MIGEAVPLVMLPRFSSFVGANTFTTAALRVSDYAKAHVSFWRGPLKSGNFSAQFEESHDGQDWDAIGSAITTTDTRDEYSISLGKRWFRLKIQIWGGYGPAITCWCTGLLERRIQG
jgi:hypothetical protein